MDDLAGEELFHLIFESGLIKTWPNQNPSGWKLSGRSWSPFYINLRDLYSKKNAQEILEGISSGLDAIIDGLDGVNKVVGVATAGIPLSTLLTYSTGIPSCYTTKIGDAQNIEDVVAKLSTQASLCKKYGEHDWVEGELLDDDRVAIIDDIVTDGNSKIIALEMIKASARDRNITVVCKDVVVVIDREQGAEERLRSAGLAIHSLIPFKSKGVGWLEGKVDDQILGVIKDYLNNPDRYQDIEFRNEVKKSLGF